MLKMLNEQRINNSEGQKVFYCFYCIRGTKRSRIFWKGLGRLQKDPKMSLIIIQEGH